MKTRGRPKPPSSRKTIGLDELAKAPDRARNLSEGRRRILTARLEAVRSALALPASPVANGNGKHESPDAIELSLEAESELHLLLQTLDAFMVDIEKYDVIAALRALDLIITILLSPIFNHWPMSRETAVRLIRAIAHLLDFHGFAQEAEEVRAASLRRARDELRWQAVITARSEGVTERDKYTRAAQILQQDGWPTIAAPTVKASYLAVEQRIPFREDVSWYVHKQGRSRKIEDLKRSAGIVDASSSDEENSLPAPSANLSAAQPKIREAQPMSDFLVAQDRLACAFAIVHSLTNVGRLPSEASKLTERLKIRQHERIPKRPLK